MGIKARKHSPWDKDKNNVSNDLEPRETAIIAKKHQQGSIEEDLNNEHRTLVARSTPFLSPKQAHILCMRQCSVIKEPCAC